MSLNLTPPNPRVRPCRIRSIANELTEKDREIFITAVNSPGKWPARALSTQLRENGLDISEGPIWAHRKGECTCSKI